MYGSTWLKRNSPLAQFQKIVDSIDRAAPIICDLHNTYGVTIKRRFAALEIPFFAITDSFCEKLSLCFVKSVNKTASVQFRNNTHIGEFLRPGGARLGVLFAQLSQSFFDSINGRVGVWPARDGRKTGSYLQELPHRRSLRTWR